MIRRYEAAPIFGVFHVFGENVMQFTARQEVAIALISALFVIAYAMTDIPVWIGFN